MKFWKRCELKKEPPIDDKVQPTETFVESKSVTMALKLYTTLSSTSTTNCFTLMFKRKLDKIYDELWRSFQTFQLNVNKLTLNPDFCPKNCALNRDACLNGHVLKWETTVVDQPQAFVGKNGLGQSAGGLDCVHTTQPWSGNSNSMSALFIKTKNHVHACPLLKPPCIHFFLAKIKQYTYISHCFKIHFHTYTRVQKQIQKLFITCVQMFGNENIWPYFMYNIKSWMKKRMIFGLVWLEHVNA